MSLPHAHARSRGLVIGLCPVCLFVDTKISSLSSKGLVEGTVQDI